MNYTIYTYYIDVCEFKDVLNKLWWMSLWIKQRGFEKGGDLTYFKCYFKDVNEEGLGWLQ